MGAERSDSSRPSFRGLICKLTILYTFDPLCLLFSDWKRYPVLDHIRKVIFALCVRDFCYILLRGIWVEGGNAVYQCPEGISLCNGGGGVSSAVFD